MISAPSTGARLRRRLVAGLGGAVALTGLAVTTSAPADAAVADTGLSGAISSLYQTNNTVTSVAVSNGVIYAAGSFTGVKPPGSSTTTARSYVAAFNASTGVVTSFNPTINGVVTQLAVSPDKSTLYIAGRFTKVNNTTRNRFASFTISTGALTSWNPNASGAGTAVLPTANAVYLGGLFTTVGGASHVDLASVNTTTGAVNAAFTGSADNQINTMALTTDGTKLLVAGNYTMLSGTNHNSFGAVDPTTGAELTFLDDGTNPLPYNVPVPDPNAPPGPPMGCQAYGEAIVVSGTTAYVSGDGVQPGCFDGDFAVNTNGTGTVTWTNACEGSTVALALLNGVLYKGSHMHDCAYYPGGSGGGFTGSFAQDQRKFYRLAAQNVGDGSFLHWGPNTGSGGTTHVGPLAMATDGTQLVVAGDFTTVNGTTQQGITRFTPKSASSNATPVRPATAPTATVLAAGKVEVDVPATYDYDNGTLTYNLYRGSTLVGTQTAESWPWDQPVLRFKVSGLSTTTSYTFTLKATDGNTTSATSTASNPVVASAANAAGSYPTSVTSNNPSLWWRLNGDASDSSGNGADGQLMGGASTDASGAVAGSSAVALDGTTGYATSNAQQTGSAAYTESVWFKTTTVHGGDLMGLSTAQTGSDMSPDRVIWMDNDGKIAAAMQTAASTDPNAPPGPRNATVRSLNTYDDGLWHQAVVTYDGTNLTEYVDGISVATTTATAAQTAPTGYYRVGYTDLSSFNAVFGSNVTGFTSPNSYFYQGSVDEASVYPSALSATAVKAEYAAASATN